MWDEHIKKPAAALTTLPSEIYYKDRPHLRLVEYPLGISFALCTFPYCAEFIAIISLSYRTMNAAQDMLCGQVGINVGKTPKCTPEYMML